MQFFVELRRSFDELRVSASQLGSGYPIHLQLRLSAHILSSSPGCLHPHWAPAIRSLLDVVDGLRLTDPPLGYGYPLRLVLLLRLSAPQLGSGYPLAF